MTQRVAPLEELQDGLPLWRIQVEDPTGAASEKRELSWRVLDFPEGRVLALLLRIFDGAGRPVIFHHALLVGGPAFLNLKSAGAVLLVFERHGFMSDARARLDLNLALLQSGAEGKAAALARYVDAYRSGLASQGSPEAAWDAIERNLATPVARTSKASWGWVSIIALLALLAALAYYFFR